MIRCQHVASASSYDGLLRKRSTDSLQVFRKKVCLATACHCVGLLNWTFSERGFSILHPTSLLHKQCPWF